MAPASKKIQISGTLLWFALTTIAIAATLLWDWQHLDWPDPSNSLTLPMLLSAAATAMVGFWAVPWLQAIKAGQFIREDGPQSHLKKAGTPTMGGIFFVPVGILLALIWFGGAPNVLAVALLSLAYAFVGFLDDWQILQRRSNKGISPKMKLLLQVVLAALFCLWLAFTQANDGSRLTTVWLPGGIALALGWGFWALAVFVLVAESNATNLTDGLDGLAGGTGAIAFLGLAAIVFSQDPTLAGFAAGFAGSCLGFLAYNRNPAKVFMGDTGSLAIGGALAGIALLSQNLWSLFLLSGIFFVETLSVIAQVGYYKATKNEDGVGKRLLKMAPLHHHLELSGWSEMKVVSVFYLIEAGLAWLAWFWQG
ncbi:phospho-N-acetylmuramoyl-pentapeptide-transferase [Geitlerinema sp. PCC 9228]|uniref:phospho-N-acetylmuramoyl-pentapeptide- transferase n=1 Tax=Geitlerinema sp. PCC 9228 TaxID=111611 RepID=UPI0008F9D8B7|nr:phospho-N-acetylmuramoyl-pentapeptide-transferase [Geitlerinema sp. PCC 9228]